MKSIKTLALIVGAISLVPAVSFAATVSGNTSALKPQLIAQRLNSPVFSQSVAIAETALGKYLDKINCIIFSKFSKNFFYRQHKSLPARIGIYFNPFIFNESPQNFNQI